MPCAETNLYPCCTLQCYCLHPQTTITGFHQDEQQDWVAELSCGHRLHMRHNPPWQVREWILTEEGRRAFIGRAVDCKKCSVAAQIAAKA